MSIELDRSPLPDPASLAGQLVSHFIDNIATRDTQLGDAIHGDIATVTKKCLEIGDGVIAGRNVSDQLDWFSAAAAGWAREAVPIDTILDAFYESLRVSVDRICTSDAAYDRDALIDRLRTTMAISNLMSTTMINAYLREYRGVVSEHLTATRALTAALLAGRATTSMARDCGVSVAETYAVMAVSIPRDPDDHDPQIDDDTLARRKLRRVHTALAEHYDDALAMLSVDGGTILIPGADTDDTRLDILIEALSRAARVDITATLVTTTTDQIPDTAQLAHDLLDIIERLGYNPRLYRFEDLALEYQLTRPGPGLTKLGELLAPLDNHPDLSDTADAHRQRHEPSAHRPTPPHPYEHHHLPAASHRELDRARRDARVRSVAAEVRGDRPRIRTGTGIPPAAGRGLGGDACPPGTTRTDTAAIVREALTARADRRPLPSSERTRCAVHKTRGAWLVSYQAFH
ncbi:PucR family transcriptional regulator [Nocardia salmonicida]|uniref:PucR family transcriptional regulator n=1 Tax=Nocardia salmonicida TaxID=53431 RepID=UPI003F548492